MKLVRLKGVIASIMGNEAAVQPDDGSAQIAVPLDACKNSEEGSRVDLMIVPPRRPGGLADVIVQSGMRGNTGFRNNAKNGGKAAARKRVSWAALMRVMLKTREQIDVLLREAKVRNEAIDNAEEGKPDRELNSGERSRSTDCSDIPDVSDLSEKREWLEKGIDLFRF
ncbi:MAG: hypothetical protein WA705_19500 [Candidatus Ozemobacteraceae bacterium]